MSNSTTPEPELSHLNQQGEANMVDVTEKAMTSRTATAQGIIKMNRATFELITTGKHKKGDVFAVARIAGIQAAKKCSDLIPLCHPLMLSKVQVDFTLDDENSQVMVTSLCRLTGQTGVEMEALTATQVALLTIYDMCKAVDRGMTMTNVRLLEKAGGKSGHWVRES